MLSLRCNVIVHRCGIVRLVAGRAPPACRGESPPAGLRALVGCVSGHWAIKTATPYCGDPAGGSLPTGDAARRRRVHGVGRCACVACPVPTGLSELTGVVADQVESTVLVSPPRSTCEPPVELAASALVFLGDWTRPDMGDELDLSRAGMLRRHRATWPGSTSAMLS